MKLSAVEKRVWDAFPTGQIVQLGPEGRVVGAPLGGEDWGADRRVRAEVIAMLLCGAVPVEPGHVASVYLCGARIVGMIDLHSTEAKYPLRLARCYVGEGVDFTDAKTRTITLCSCYLGPVRLSRAEISGNLDLSHAHLNGYEGRALDAAVLTVTGDLLCKDLRAEGEIHLRGALVKGRISFHGAQLGSEGSEGPALNVDRLTVIGGMTCRDLRADGGVRLRAANISGELKFDGAQLSGKGDDGPALSAEALIVTGAFYCKHLQADGVVSLALAKIDVIVDDEQFWSSRMDLDGLVYGDLHPYLQARQRLTWLRRAASYRPQPYEQLATYYRRLGYDEQARRVLLAKQRKRTNQGAWWVRLWGWVQDGLAGYGYSPVRAIGWLVAALVVGGIYFSGHHPPPVHANGNPTFHPALYTLDLLIPGLGLGQAGDWNPQGRALFVVIGLRAFGWLLAITVIAAITRSLSRN